MKFLSYNGLIYFGDKIKTKLLGGSIITAEGSGDETKYYIQLGADAASKKELGSNNAELLGTISPVWPPDVDTSNGFVFYNSTINVSSRSDYASLKASDFTAVFVKSQTLVTSNGGGGWCQL